MLPALPTGTKSASSAPELVEDLERRRLLALEPERVDRVDERDRMALPQLADELSALSNCRHRDHPGAVDEGLGELAEGDLALGHDDAPEPAAAAYAAATRRCCRSRRR